MSREGGGDTQVRAEFTVVCWAEPWCADYCCVSEFRGQRCMCAASKSALTTLNLEASNGRRYNISGNWNWEKSALFCFFLLFFVKVENNRRKQLFSPAVASVCKGCFYAALLWLFQARCFWLQRGIGASILCSSDSGLTGWSAVSLIHPRRRSGCLTLCLLMFCFCV